MKFNYGKIIGFICLALLGLQALAATQSQERGWQKYNSESKVQNFIWSEAYSLYCGDYTNNSTECANWTRDALNDQCISQQIYDMLRNKKFKPKRDSSSSYYYFPECNRRAELLAICKCGCFVKGTRLLGILQQSQDWHKIEDLMQQQGLLTVMANGELSLDEGFGVSTAENPHYVASQNLHKTRDTVVIVAEVEGEKVRLQLTPNHPVLTAEGSFLEAEKLEVGQLIVDYLGNSVAVEALERVPYTGQVFNVDTQSESHVVFAEKLAVGDLFIQDKMDHMRARLDARKWSKEVKE